MATEGRRGGLLEKIIPFLGAEREKAALRNDAMRARIEGLENQNRSATKLEGLFSSRIGERERLPSFELEGLLGDDGTVAPSTPVHNLTRPEDRGLFEIQTPEGQAQAQGLLAHLAPQQLGSSLLGSPKERTNTTQQKLDAWLGVADQLFPDDPRKALEYAAEKASSGSSDFAKVIAEHNFRQQLRDDEQKQFAANQHFTRTEIGLNRGLERMVSAAGVNEKLEPTALRTGQFSDFFQGLIGVQAAGMRFAGMDASEKEEMLTNFNIFEKDISNILLDILPNLDGINAGSNEKLRAIQSSLANPTNEPGANSRILASAMQDILDISDIGHDATQRTFEIRNREKIESIIETLKRGGSLVEAAASQSAFGGIEVTKTATDANGQKIGWTGSGWVDESGNPVVVE